MFLTTLCLLLALSSKVTSLEKSVDLSWDFGSNTVYISGMRKFAFEKEIESSSDRGYWYSVKEFCAAEHGGTHFDAPYHFYQEGIKVSEIPAQKLFAKGALINLTAEAEEQGRNARLTVKHLEAWEARNGNFEIGSVLLVQFGRSKYWQNRTKYLDLEGETLNFPDEAARWIVNSQKFYGVGLDTPSIDPGNTTTYFAHRHLAANNLYNLENVKILDSLPDKGFDLVIAPMKIQDGTGAPVRIFATLKNV
uniref:Cyclase n=1 Tax=Dendroctonus ponderosae TaxID=77166 RepID=A0AAR5Q0V7_DENPD